MTANADDYASLLTPLEVQDALDWCVQWDEAPCAALPCICLGRRTPRRPQSPAHASCLAAPVHLFPVAPAPRLLKVPADGFLGLPDLVDSPTAVLPDGEGRWTGQPPGHVHRLLA